MAYIPIVIPLRISRLSVLCLAALAAAGEAVSTSPLDQAEVILHVRDGRWVDREATRFASAYGGDAAAVRGELARVLYHASSFDGIDLGRPALIARRPGKAPLLAAIPVADRGKFLGAFGAVEHDEPPLVRTGEREGTVIYRQNQPGGEWEYRLLVAGGTAYLARTAEECRQLAVAIGTPVHDPFAPPVELTLRGDGLTAARLPGAAWFAALPPTPLGAAEFSSVPGLLPGAWAAIAGQVAAISLTAQSDAQGRLVVGARLAAKPDSALAVWIAAQRPGTERLAGQLRRPGTAVLATGRLSFQGQLERWAFDQGEALRVAAGARWTEAADGAFRSLCTLIERSGAFAVALERSGAGAQQQWVVEHPRAIEVVQSVAVLAGALRGEDPQVIKLDERSAFSLARGATICVAGDRHAVRVDDHGTGRSAAAGEVLARLESPGGLDAAPSLLAVWIDVAQAWKVPPAADGEPAEAVLITGVLRQSGPGQLSCSAEVPLAGFGKLLGRLNKTTRND
jgi:hypothetical protein